MAITYKVTSFQRRLAAARSDDDSSTAEDEIKAKRPAAATAFVLPVTTCRQILRLWFVVDDTSRRGPYRLLDHACRSSLARANFEAAQRLVTWLVDVAVTHGLIDAAAALATLASPELLVVFDETFGVALDADDDGMLMRHGFEDFALDQVGQMKYTLVLQRLEMMPPCASPTNSNGGGSALPPPTPSKKLFRWADGTAPEGWIFPQLSCRHLWCKWYFGDDDDGHHCVGPYRHLQPSGVGDSNVMRRPRGAVCHGVPRGHCREAAVCRAAPRDGRHSTKTTRWSCLSERSTCSCSTTRTGTS
ncbi:Aste57867_19667 [Aphanomyces stellatus]|uniref:Aste57867_19667 protein n=1 Tax=Aphanomyces stellatus TaxID=120398 RepID=A0A485LDS5_9STRA|nr:hypothetical protein As57867_019602 [Aphanomyces stellatus]VFT96367.1 Aste57867_19667 [Aphanomyces stellatus]